MRKIFDKLIYISQVGLTILVPVVILFFLGLYLDGKFGTKFLSIVGFFIGALGGFSGAYKMIMKAFNGGDGSERKG